MPINSGTGAYVLHITPDAMMGRALSAAGFVNLAAIPRTRDFPSVPQAE